MDASDRATATGRRSAAQRLRAAVLAAAILAALLLVAAEASTIASVDVIGGDSCEVVNDSSPELADRCSLSGWERHGGALVLLAAVAVGAGVAVRRGSTEAGGGVLAAVGVVVLALTLISDLPVTDETGAIGLNFAGATASAGLGFYLELVGGVLCLLAGGLALAGGRRERGPA